MATRRINRNQERVRRSKKLHHKKTVHAGVSFFVLGFFALSVGIVLWKNGQNMFNPSNYGVAQEMVSQGNEKLPDVPEAKAEECKTHYYEGEGTVNAWKIEQSGDGKEVVVQITEDSLAQLPTDVQPTDEQENGFSVKLVDATAETLEKLSNSSPNEPAEITIRGFATFCDAMPKMSLDPATVAFKKS